MTDFAPTGHFDPVRGIRCRYCKRYAQEHIGYHCPSWWRRLLLALGLLLVVSCSVQPKRQMSECNDTCLRQYPLVLPLPNFDPREAE